MDIEKIRTLIELMEEKDLVSMEVASGDERVSLTRHYATPAPTMISAPPIETTSTPNTTTTSPKPGTLETAPMVGVFYAAPSPNDPPFVKVGQTVQAGDTLGIIEAMKIMNPLEATQSGIIEEILVQNGDVVQFGQPVVRYKA
ncbi:acetyl-CoA carboxylase biotin carboxyl carrier protein [Psychrobacter sp. I-STPA6b]|uniref:acetyl-CoA carboxylase biotin carboxyl carrier protein n=1 Tax=Psychrobacter sp. I-STPA6b TaxID=2585718 RepID=UPI001D0C9F0B|nr:acetyl-CoA carboxylase biotin carboxyl carrier protein [Psychrobacter sp. I-STPA6b]